jgi:flagellar FliL protein
MAEKQDAAAEKTEKSGGGSKLVPILMLVNTLLLAGVLALLFLRAPGGHAATAAPEGVHGEAKADEHGAAKADGGHGEKKEEGGHGEATAEGAHGEAKPGKAPGPTLALPDFIVHLRDTDADRYARVSFEVELGDEKAKEVVNGRLPQVRDAFLTHLSDRTVDELRGSEAIAQLKDALTQRLRSIAPEAPVKALYVTQLVVQ